MHPFKVVSGTFQTRFGGLFFFARDLVDTQRASAVAHLPGSDPLPADCVIRALLALKLWGMGRPSHVMPYILDEGPPLFAGLHVLPKKSTLTEYSTRVDARDLDTLRDTLYARVLSGPKYGLAGPGFRSDSLTTVTSSRCQHLMSPAAVGGSGAFWHL